MNHFPEKLRQNRAATLLSLILLILLGRAGYLLLQQLYGHVVTDPSLFLPGQESVLAPEPAEQQTYVLLLLAALPVMYGTLCLSRRFRLPGRLPPAAWCIFSFVMLLWPTAEWLYIIALHSLDAPWKIPVIAAIMVVAGAALFRFRAKKGKTAILIGLLGIAAVLSFNFSLYLPGYLTEYFTHHFEVLCFPIAQAARGQVPLHQYGFYPNFLAPLWSLLPLSTLSVNIVFLVLAWACLAVLLIAFHRIARSGIALLLTGIVLIYLCTPVAAVANGEVLDPYFAYFPIRTLFPVLHIAFFLYFLRAEKQLHATWWLLLGAFAGCGVFWNLDSGIVGTVCWGVFLVLDGRLREWRRVGWFAAGWVAACVVLWNYLGILGDEPLTFAALFRAPKIFAENGFFMIPLPDWPCAWGFFAVVYGIGLSFGVAGMLLPGTTTPSRRARTTFFLALMGCGLAAYYVGRSHNLSLGSCIFPAVVLLGIFLDDAARLFPLKQMRSGAVCTVLPMLLLFALFALNLILFAPQICFAAKFNCSALAANRISEFRADADLIRRCADGRAVNIFGPYQSILFLESGCRADIVNSSEIEIILREEYIRLLDALARSEAPLFINNWSRFLPEEFLGRYYVLKGVSPTGVRYYEPRAAAGGGGTE